MCPVYGVHSNDEYDLAQQNKSVLKDVLSKYKYIYITGGNTFYLLKMIKETGFDQILTDLLNDGTVLLGSSAGSYITCPTIETATWSIPQRHFKYGIEDLSGLNLVPFLIKAHYVEKKREAIIKGITESKYKTYVLNDDQAILFEDGKVSIYGDPHLVNLTTIKICI